MREAHPGQVISSHQKDTDFRDHLKSLILDFVSSITKERSWMKHVKDISIVADIIYFAFTTLSGNQTMGEEYSNILLVNKIKTSLPSRFKSALMVVFHVILPHTIDKSTTYLTHLTQRNQEMTDARKRKILNIIKIFNGLLKFLEKFNSILFYLNGAYFHISKRLTNVLYLQTRPLKFDSTYNRTYSFLGWLMMLQSLVSISLYVFNAWRASSNNANFFLYNLLGVNLFASASSAGNEQTSTLASLSSYLLRNISKRKNSSKEGDETDQQDPKEGDETDQQDPKDGDETDQQDPKDAPLTVPSPQHTSSSSTPIPSELNQNNETNCNNSHSNTNPIDKAERRSADASIYRKNNKVVRNKLPEGKKRLCSLCCDHLHQPTSTLCGHVFCWQCITEWCVKKLECPICKQEIVMARLVFLKNFA